MHRAVIAGFVAVCFVGATLPQTGALKNPGSARIVRHYTLSGSSWVPLTTAQSTGALTNPGVADAVLDYCQANPPSGPWTPCSFSTSTNTVSALTASQINQAQTLTDTVTNVTCSLVLINGKLYCQ